MYSFQTFIKTFINRDKRAFHLVGGKSWMGDGILTSLLIFTLSVQILSDSAFRHGGEVADISHLGVFMYTMIIWTVICQIALITIHFTTWIQNMLICGSVLCWYIVSCGPCTHPHC